MRVGVGSWELGVEWSGVGGCRVSKHRIGASRTPNGSGTTKMTFAYGPCPVNEVERWKVKEEEKEEKEE